MVVFRHHGHNWSLYSAVMDVQDLLLDRLLGHRDVFVRVDWLGVVGDLQSYILGTIRITSSDSHGRMMLRLELKHLR